MSYAPEVEPYLNSNRHLDNLLGDLLSAGQTGKDGEPDVEYASRALAKACIESPNIKSFAGYVSHVICVSKNNKKIGGVIVKNYPFLENQLNPELLSFAGIIHDFIKPIGRYGASKEGPDSDAVHEILTYAQLRHMAKETGNEMYKKLAQGIGMHGISPQILELEHEAGRLLTINYEDKPNPMLDVVTGVDMLCEDYWLPLETGGDMQKALEYRVNKVVESRIKSHGRNHQLVIAAERGGRERVERIVGRLERLSQKKYSEEEVEEIYSLGDKK